MEPGAERVSAAELYARTGHVIGQDAARRQLAVVFERQQQVRDGDLRASAGVLVAGPSGTGKTMLVRAMGEASGIPFAAVDATKFSETGYIGLDLVQMFLPLLTTAIRAQLRERRLQRLIEGEASELDRVESIVKLPDEILEPALEEAQTGVILLDEFDKWLQMGQDDKGRNPGRVLMSELLKMLEGSLEYVRDSDDEVGLPFDTTKVLIVCTGAFVGLNKSVAKRLERDELEVKPDAVWEQMMPIDLVSFGLMPELVGRLSTIIALNPLTEDHFMHIIREESGLVEEFVMRFANNDCELVVEPAGLATVARIAKGRGTGARGLRQVLEKLLSEALFASSAHDGPGRVVLDVDAASRQLAVHVAR